MEIKGHPMQASDMSKGLLVKQHVVGGVNIAGSLLQLAYRRQDNYKEWYGAWTAPSLVPAEPVIVQAEALPRLPPLCSDHLLFFLSFHSWLSQTSWSNTLVMDEHPCPHICPLSLHTPRSMIHSWRKDQRRGQHWPW